MQYLSHTTSASIFPFAVGKQSYPCGQIGFILAHKGSSSDKNVKRSCSKPVRRPTFQNDLKWYNPQMHQAAFVLPQYVKVELDDGESVLDEIYNDEDDDDEEGDRCVLSGCIIS